MAIAHCFTDDNDYTQGGRWIDDYGRLLCRWTWDTSSLELSVTSGSVGRRQDLSSLNKEWLTDTELRARLPRLAIELAERLKNTTYDL